MAREARGGLGAAPAPQDGPGEGMPLLAHLEELRKRLFVAALGIVVAFALCAWQVDVLFAWCEQPYRKVVAEPLSVIAITEAFFIKLRVAFLASLFLSAPLTLWQAWLFVCPALYPHERRWAVPFVASASAFFLAGGAFGFYVGMPAMLSFLLGQAATGFELDIRADNYISTLSRVVLGMGLVFEAPVLTAFLARFGLVDHRWLLRKFRHAVVIVAIASAVVTPSGDIPTMVVFMVPMLALYALSVLVAWALGKPRRKEA